MTPRTLQGASGAPIVLRTGPGTGRPVVILPAMGVPARWYDVLAEALGEHGLPTAVVELPGQGESPRRPAQEPEVGYGRLVEDEVATALADAAARHAGVAPVVVGHSLGGQLAVLAAAKGVGPIAGIALPATGTVHWRAYSTPRGLGILALTQVGAVLARMMGVHRGDRLGFGGVQPRQLFCEWADVARTGRWCLAGEEVDLGRVDVPVLSVTVPGDIYAPRMVADALLADLTGTDITRHDLKADAFDRPVGHLQWLKHPGPVADRIVTWMDSHVPTAAADQPQEQR